MSMLKQVTSFFGTVAKAVAAKVVAGIGPATKQAVASLDPQFDMKVGSRHHENGESRLHWVCDASINLPGDLDDAAAGAINATGIAGLGNSPSDSSQPGTSPSN